MLTRFIWAIAITQMLVIDALAQHSPSKSYSSGDIIFAILLTAIIASFATLYVATMSSGPPTPRAWTPEEYDQDATRLRAAGRHAEAKADYDDRRARMKLKEEELREVEVFLAQQRGKRDDKSKPGKN